MVDNDTGCWKRQARSKGMTRLNVTRYVVAGDGDGLHMEHEGHHEGHTSVSTREATH